MATDGVYGTADRKDTSEAYVAGLIEVLTDRGCRLVLNEADALSVRGETNRLTPQIMELLRARKPAILEYMKARRANAPPPLAREVDGSLNDIAMPDADRLVVWEGARGTGGECAGEDLPFANWKRWRYADDAEWVEWPRFWPV